MGLHVALKRVFLAAAVLASAPAWGQDVDGGTDASTDVSPAPTMEPTPAPAPPATVSFRGRLFGRGTGEPLVGATVTLGLEALAESDAAGRFAVTLSPGTHRLQIQQPGYEPLDLIVEAKAGEDIAETELRLDPRLTGERYETVINAPDPHGGRTLRDEELTRTPGSFGDPMRVIESLPGVSQVVWPLALYAIRGANPGNTGFFIDGVRMPALYHFALGPSVIHPYFIEQVDFYPGGYPIRYGRYVSGAVAAKTRTPPADRTHGSVDVRLFDAGGLVVTPVNGGKGSVAVAARMSYTGLIFSVLSPDYTFNYWDYQLRVEHKLGPGRLVLFGFGAGDRLGRKSRPDDDAQLDFHRLNLRWLGSALGGRLAVDGVVGYDRSATSIKNLVSLPISVRTLSAGGRVSFVRPLLERLELELGGDGEYQRLRPRSSLVVAQDQDLFQNRSSVVGGAYAALNVRTGKGSTLSLGYRHDIFVQQGKSVDEWGPRLSWRQHVGGDVFLKTTVGRYVQQASLPVAVPGFENFGLGTYGTQWSVQGAAGVEAPIGSALQVDVTGFIQRLKLTDLDSVFNYDPQLEIVERRDGRAYGVELLVRRPLKERLYGWVSYTLSWSERVVGGYNIRGPSDWDQRHILNVVAGYRFAGGFGMGARFHYHSGRPYPVFNDRNDGVVYQRLPAFYQIDVRADRRFVFDRFTLDAYIELVNTTLTREVFDIKRNQDGSVTEGAFKIVLPSIGVRAEW